MTKASSVKNRLIERGCHKGLKTIQGRMKSSPKMLQRLLSCNSKTPMPCLLFTTSRKMAFACGGLIWCMLKYMVRNPPWINLSKVWTRNTCQFTFRGINRLFFKGNMGIWLLCTLESRYIGIEISQYHLYIFSNMLADMNLYFRAWPSSTLNCWDHTSLTAYSVLCSLFLWSVFFKSTAHPSNSWTYLNTNLQLWYYCFLEEHGQELGQQQKWELSQALEVLNTIYLILIIIVTSVKRFSGYWGTVRERERERECVCVCVCVCVCMQEFK